MTAIDRREVQTIGRKDGGYGYNGKAAHVEAETPQLVIIPEGFGFKAGIDPLERAIDFDPTTPAKVLRDLNRGGMRLLAPALNPEVQEALGAANISVEELDGQDPSKKLERVKNEDDLAAFARKRILVEDTTRFLEVAKNAGDSGLNHVLNGLLVSSEAVEAPDAFARFIRLEPSTDGNALSMIVDGERQAAFDMTNKRIFAQVRDSLSKARSAAPERRVIRMPDTSIGMTSLEQETRFMETRRAYIMHDYEAPKGRTDEAVLSILLAHTEDSVQVSKNDRERLEGQIQAFTKKGEPVPVSISMAIATRIPNPLKFREGDNLPTYAWLHFADFMKTINDKVQKVHKPGIDVVVFDEATLFGDMLGIPAESIAQHLDSTRRLIAAVGAPVRIIPLEASMFPESEVGKIKATVDDDKIYSIVCSRPDMTIESVMDPLYTDRQNRSYADIRRQVGQRVWDESREMAETIAQYLEWRKRANLFDKLVGPIAVDATVTDKDGRVVFDVTSNALFNHAMPVVRRNNQGMHRVHIVPEYRIGREHATAKPVKLPKSDLGAGSGNTTFLYEAR